MAFHPRGDRERCTQVPRSTVNGALFSGKWADSIGGMAEDDEVRRGAGFYRLTTERRAGSCALLIAEICG